jgi:hypothetical protein
MSLLIAYYALYFDLSLQKKILRIKDHNLSNLRRKDIINL